VNVSEPRTARVDDAYVVEKLVDEALSVVSVCCTVRLVEMFASPTTSSFASVEVAVAPIKTWFVEVETRIPELLKKVQLISLEPPAPESVPHEKVPVVALYNTVSDSDAQFVNPDWKNPRESCNDVDDANPFTCKPLV
jgi:hypothetical protein